MKPQSAFYERFGSRGVAVLERVIADVTRGRRAGAARRQARRHRLHRQAYADAYLDPASPLAADAITASPFLGFGSLDPMVDTARKHDAGVFVLALTSNKEGPEVQHATGTGRRHRRRQRCSTGCARLNAGAEPLGSFGAVVGATIGEHRRGPRHQRAAPRARVRRPGRHAGRPPADLRRARPATSWPSSSREVLALGPDPAALRDGAAGPTTTSPDSPDEPLAALACRPGRRLLAGLGGCACRRRSRLLRGGRGAPGRAGRARSPRTARTRLLDALPTFRELQDEAPRDIGDEWEQVVDAAWRRSRRPWTTPASTRRRTTRSTPPAGRRATTSGRDRRCRRPGRVGGDPAGAARAGAAGARRVPDAA